jgi:hypothetical protein
MELMDHYNWYVEDAEDNNEIPLSYTEYQREIEPNVIALLGEIE